MAKPIEVRLVSATHKVISLFSGAGGLDLGLEAAGFGTAVAVELDDDAVRTLQANRDWLVEDRDIHEIPSKVLLEKAEAAVGDVDLLAGGPPCQPFSKSGYWARGDAARLDDPRASTLEAYLRVLRDTQPKAFLLENVAGLAYRNKSEGLELLSRTIDQINAAVGTSYSFKGKLLNAADYGVPQFRERFFVVGLRDGTEFKFPDPTHGSSKQRASQAELFEEAPPLVPHRTAWDAIGDLDEEGSDLQVTGKWAKLLPSIPEGENYLWHTNRGGGLPLFGWRRRYWSFLLKLSKRLPSWTITAQPGSAIGPFHWKSRRLSMRELSRIQTFPDSYEVTGGRTAYQRQLGNAVPSALAEVLGLAIRQAIGHDVEKRPLSLVPSRLQPVPRKERVRKVPAEYLDLVGDHEDHPGTGQGYAARRRAEQGSS